MNSILFDGWDTLARTVTLGVLGYASLVVILRVAGKRTLAKMNAFDLVVTIALGSTLATLLLSKDTPLAQGVVGLLVLIGLQFVISWASVRVRWVRRIVSSEPTLLLYRGGYLPGMLRRSRVTTEEVRAAVRSAGHAAIEQVHAVVLETDGSFSVIAQDDAIEASSLAGVRMPDAEADADDDARG
ncbi:DUF421 domain-containing protein [Enhygromyxa salina]|uniref:DUF421 domain-containing protein n=1 Tax=Enhygromyxa salina TaxID=215803 RepID=A0A2S9Y2M5_9BACT|nr:YetF domain-containing protein [Enhygromyxa salina]PRP99281.1 hypothetical protein ENSA7_63230 [Enhygromyxa salina]